MRYGIKYKQKYKENRAYLVIMLNKNLNYIKKVSKNLNKPFNIIQFRKQFVEPLTEFTREARNLKKNNDFEASKLFLTRLCEVFNECKGDVNYFETLYTNYKREFINNEETNLKDVL